MQRDVRGALDRYRSQLYEFESYLNNVTADRKEMGVKKTVSFTHHLKAMAESRQNSNQLVKKAINSVVFKTRTYNKLCDLLYPWIYNRPVCKIKCII